MRHWKVKIKEKAMKHPFTSILHGNNDRDDVIKFYGLDEPDVEWYEMEEVFGEYAKLRERK